MHLLHLPSKTSVWTIESSLETSGQFHCLCREKGKGDYPSCYLFNNSLMLMSCCSVSLAQRTGRDCLGCYTFTKTSFCLASSALDWMKGFREKGYYKCIWKGIDVLAVKRNDFVPTPLLSWGSFQWQSDILFVGTFDSMFWLWNIYCIGLCIFYQCWKDHHNVMVLQGGGPNFRPDPRGKRVSKADSLTASLPI